MIVCAALCVRNDKLTFYDCFRAASGRSEKDRLCPACASPEMLTLFRSSLKRAKSEDEAQFVIPKQQTIDPHYLH